jgi:hypothetical protein
MANVFEQPEVIAAEALMHLEDSLVITSKTAKDVTSEFNKTQNGYAVGQSVNFKTRPAYIAKEFTGNIDRQEIRETSRPMIIEKHFDVSVDLTAIELAMDLDNFSDQVIQPAAYALAEKVDGYAGSKILQGQGLYASTTVLNTAADMALARSAANYQQLNPMGRYGLVNSTLEARLLGAEYFNRSNFRGADAEKTLRDADMGKVMNFDWSASMNVPEATQSQSSETTVTDNSGNSNKVGATSLKVGATSVAIADGAFMKVAGCRRYLRVSGDVSTGATSIPLVDPITEIISDAAAVTFPNAGKVVTVMGALFDSDSIGVAMPVLDRPEDKASSVISANGVSIRIVKGYNMDTKKTTLSLDLLCAAMAIDPRRITIIGDAA